MAILKLLRPFLLAVTLALLAFLTSLTFWNLCVTFILPLVLLFLYIRVFGYEDPKLRGRSLGKVSTSTIFLCLSIYARVFLPFLSSLMFFICEWFIMIKDHAKTTKEP